PEGGARADLVSLVAERRVGDLPREGEPSLVGRDFRCGGTAARKAARRGAAALAGGDVDDIAGAEVEASQLQRPGEWLMVGDIDRRLVVHEVTVRGYRWPCRRATSRTTATASTTRADELNPLPSVLVVHV